MLLRNATNGRVLATQVKRARDPISRGVGLLGRSALTPDEGLWIDRCSAVHTIGMRATLDLYFLDVEKRVLRIVHGVKPYRLAVACRNAVSVVELGASAETGRDVLVGDRLELE